MDHRDREQTARSGRRRTAAILISGFFLADGILRTLYFYLGDRATGSPTSFVDTLVSETTGSLASAMVFFAVVLPFARRWRVDGRNWTRRVPVHVAGLLVYSVVKTFLMWVMRLALFPLAGLGAYDYGRLIFRFPMEGANDVLGYVMFSVAVHIWDQWEETRARELRAAQLESEITQARLTALQFQLQPHFLFNTLNTIGSLTYDDPTTADRMITRLADLLRHTLTQPVDDEVTFREEMEFVEEYVDILRARFGERLRFRIDVSPEVGSVPVPAFLLQPIVENAVKFAVEPRRDGGCIVVRAHREDGRLHVAVEDDGPGRVEGKRPEGTGVGLANTRRRLELLYGDRASLQVGGRPGEKGGLVVRMDLPLRDDEREPASTGNSAAVSDDEHA